MIPKITIKYGRLIDPYLKDWVRINYPDYEFPSEDEVRKKVEVFKRVYESNGKDLLEKAVEFTDLDFKRNMIDVFIVSAINLDMSSPVIIRSRYNENEFLEMLIHELLHVLFNDNKVKYEHKNRTVRNHVLVFRTMRHLGFELNPKDDNYKLAWELSKK